MNNNWLIINGIRTNSEDWNFADSTIEILEDNGIRASAHEYDEVGTILRKLREGKRVAEIVTKLDRLAVRSPVCILAHSYGCHLALRASIACRVPPVELHLVAGAFDTDSDRSGLNEYLRLDPQARVYIYRAGCDNAMWWASVSRKASFGLMGYGGGGTMGNAAADYSVDQSLARRVWFRDRSDFGHSDFLEGQNLPDLLTLAAGIPGVPLVVEETNAAEAMR